MYARDRDSTPIDRDRIQAEAAGHICCTTLSRAYRRTRSSLAYGTVQASKLLCNTRHAKQTHRIPQGKRLSASPHHFAYGGGRLRGERTRLEEHSKVAIAGRMRSQASKAFFFFLNNVGKQSYGKNGAPWTEEWGHGRYARGGANRDSCRLLLRDPPLPAGSSDSGPVATTWRLTCGPSREPFLCVSVCVWISRFYEYRRSTPRLLLDDG